LIKIKVAGRRQAYKSVCGMRGFKISRTPDRITGAEGVDLSTHWHWLARQKEFDQPSVEDIEFA
jgi:hypothetical protein